MKLILDQGNTLMKIALYKGEQLEYLHREEHIGVKEIEQLCSEYPISSAILSTVKRVPEELIRSLRNYTFPLIEFSSETPLPISVAYKTPHTLGRDRLAAVVGAWMLNPRQPSFVIDAGTAITYDFIDANGCYHGGNISVGLELRNKALSRYTEKLPMINIEGDTPELGYSTETALRSGIVNGLLFEIERYIEIIKHNHTNVSFFLTGGDAKCLANKLKYSIFAEPNLVMIGLKRILEYNVE